MRTRSIRALRTPAPLATYRFQFNLDFTFRDATALIPYLADLGVSDLYASPYLQARPGSQHGYDISDHGRLNPDVGSEDDHRAMTDALKQHSLGHILDIVPNHMGIGEESNRWWMDVLENGPSSPYAPYFDIDWQPLKPELTGKILLPVLGDQFGTILERGELQLCFDEGRFQIHYHDHVYPVSPRSSSQVLGAVLEEMRSRATPDEDALTELESIVTALQHLPERNRSDGAAVAERRRESAVSRRRLMAAHTGSAAFREGLAAALDRYNGRPGEPNSFDDLEELLDDQAYRLAYWRVAAEEINYRRFFDINDLAGVRVERREVFDATHRLILQMVAEGKVTGLRIDHPDGLFDPDGYLRRLQEEARSRIGAGGVYVIVEKILTGEEQLPRDWPVSGTVGYEFMNRVNGVYVDTGNESAMTEVYESFIDERIDFAGLVYRKKKFILRMALASELTVLAYLLNRISEKNRRSRDFTLGSLTDALRETIACFPVYRTYIDAVAGRVAPTDSEQVERAIDTALRRNRASSPSIFEFIRNILLLRWPDDLEPEARDEHAQFVMKFQQLTGPVMAKGVEDTSFYIYNRLVSLNEVGGEPDRFGVAPAYLHGWLEERSRTWPDAMSGSSTHDSKRSEDVRARINVLSEMPAEWKERVSRWAAYNAPARGIADGEPIPDANDEYLLYQTIVGTWPLDLGDPAQNSAYRERIQRYMEKATREAKRHTSWINPNQVYDDGLNKFVGKLLEFGVDWPERHDFLRDMNEFHGQIAWCGMINSLSQLLLKSTAPGVPDFYQGQELWDLSLVDPDNRQPVDYERRQALIADLRGRLAGGTSAGDLARELFGEWRDGRVKLFVTHRALELRHSARGVFDRGRYLPLEVEGEWADHAFAFARQSESGTIVVVAPRLPLRFRRGTGGEMADPAAWGDTRIDGPTEILGGSFRNVFTGASHRANSGSERSSIAVGELFDGFPLGLLERR